VAPSTLPGFDALSLAQPQKGYRFGPESLVIADLLARFAPQSPDRVLDLGCGCGVLGLIASATTGAQAVLVERNQEMAGFARRNLGRLPGAELRVGDLRDIDLPTCDLVVANPPFFDPGDGTESGRASTREATHAFHGAVEEFVTVAARCLSSAGQCWVVYPADRLVRLLDAASAAALHPAAIVSLHARHTRRAYRVWACFETIPTPTRHLCLSTWTDR
jgi:tRNA1(Val) A37 N6-methylase TrmN6